MTNYIDSITKCLIIDLIIYYIFYLVNIAEIIIYK